MKSRIISTEYDDMTGYGLLPAGLFLYLGERYARNVAGLKKEMHLLWTITIKRPGYKRIVHSIDFSNDCENIRVNAEKISCHKV